MKHHLSSFRRSPWLRVVCVLLLAMLCAPCAMAAAITPAPVLASGWNPLMVAGVGLAGLGLMSAAKGNGEENGGGGGESKQEEKPMDPAAAIQAIEDRSLPMSQRLNVALNALRGIAPADQFAKVQADLATAQTDLTKARADLDAANKQIAALQADLLAVEKEKTGLAQENKDLKAKEQDLEKRASAQAKSIVQSVGIDANKLPGAQSETQGGSVESLRAKLNNPNSSLDAAERGKLVAQIRKLEAEA